MDTQQFATKLWHNNCKNQHKKLLLQITRKKQGNRRLHFASSVHCHHRFPQIRDVAYHQHAGGGPSHGHRQHTQKFGKDHACGSGDILVDRQTDRQTDILITILRNCFCSKVKNIYLLMNRYEVKRNIFSGSEIINTILHMVKQSPTVRCQGNVIWAGTAWPSQLYQWTSLLQTKCYGIIVIQKT